MTRGQLASSQDAAARRGFNGKTNARSSERAGGREGSPAEAKRRGCQQRQAFQMHGEDSGPPGKGTSATTARELMEKPTPWENTETRHKGRPQRRQKDGAGTGDKGPCPPVTFGLDASPVLLPGPSKTQNALRIPEHSSEYSRTQDFYRSAAENLIMLNGARDRGRPGGSERVSRSGLSEWSDGCLSAPQTSLVFQVVLW